MPLVALVRDWAKRKGVLTYDAILLTRSRKHFERVEAGVEVEQPVYLDELQPPQPARSQARAVRSAMAPVGQASAHWRATRRRP